MPWLKRAADGSLLLSLHVQPGAKQTALAGFYGESLKVRLAAPPVDGRANASLIAWLSERLEVTRASIELVSGESSRKKRVRVSGVDEAHCRARLAQPES